MAKDRRTKNLKPMEKIIGWGIIRQAKSIEYMKNRKYGGK